MLLHGFGWEVPGGLASTTCWITYTSDRSTIFTPIFTPTLDVNALYIGPSCGVSYTYRYTPRYRTLHAMYLTCTA